MQNENFAYEIKESYAVLSQDGNITKELNLISYNQAPAKFDLRSWKKSQEQRKMLKGITLTLEEARALKEALNNIAEL